MSHGANGAWRGGGREVGDNRIEKGDGTFPSVDHVFTTLVLRRAPTAASMGSHRSSERSQKAKRKDHPQHNISSMGGGNNATMTKINHHR